MRIAVLLTIGLLAGAGMARAQPAVVLEALTDRKLYRESVGSEVYVEARVTPTASANATPTIRNVALVLDRSGSMAGDPVDALRKAAAAFIGRLGEHDIISVILFGSEIETLIEAQPRGRLQDLDARIARIEPAGGAALYDALNQAAAQLRRHATAGTFEQLVLVTDGPPTKGPREADDFARLAEVLAREGIAISTIGLGGDFNEDVLAAMARVGHGQFRFAATPGQLAKALQAEIAAAPVVVGRDAVLTVEFKRHSSKLRSHTWRAPALNGSVAMYQFPRLLAGQPIEILVSTEVDSFNARFEIADFAVVRLRWKTADGGEAKELLRLVPVRFSADSADLREPPPVEIARMGANVNIRDGLQNAIEALDKNDPRRALRVLRTARTSARDINFDLDDSRVAEQIRQLDGYLAEVQARVMGAFDRKVLRSGLLNRFDPPAPTVDAKK